MAKKIYTLKEPSVLTLDRVLEVQFYLFTKTLLAKYGLQNVFSDQLTEILCTLFQINHAAISSASTLLLDPRIKPTTEEIVVCAEHLGLKVRTVLDIEKIAGSTYYTYLKNYINRDEPVLEPKLTLAHRAAIKPFLENAKILFKNVSELFIGDFNDYN